jgi:membrane protease YdiL (CAAX protease family)
MQSTTTQPSSTSPLLSRLALPILKFLLLTASLYIVPTLIHTAVRALDALYELQGRRSRSPYTLSTILAASALLVAWHVWVGRLSYKTIVEGKRRGGVSWGRVLGRVIVPGILIIFGLGFVGEVVGRVIRG